MKILKLNRTTLSGLWVLALLLLQVQAWAVYPDDDREDNDWYRCRKKEDCIVGYGVCGDATPIHRKYKATYAEWAKLKRKSPGFVCTNFLKPRIPKNPIMGCSAGSCSFKDGK